MAPDGTVGTLEREIGGVEEQLSLHLERAQELALRAQRANNAAQAQIDRAREIANGLRGVVRGEW